MNDILVLDIETVRDDTLPELLLKSLHDAIEVKADGRMTDPDKIKADVEKKYNAAVTDMAEKFGLSAMTGKICAVGWWGGTHGAGKNTIDWGTPSPLCETSKDERALLNKIALMLDAAGHLVMLVTFNGKSFDLPFIKVRAAINNIRLPALPRDSKYDLSRHFDVRSALTNFDQFGKGTLSQWALLFGLKVGEGASGKDVQALYNANDLVTIDEHCKGDVALTAKLYERIFTHF